jgi:hypothetical protein
MSGIERIGTSFIQAGGRRPAAAGGGGFAVAGEQAAPAGATVATAEAGALSVLLAADEAEERRQRNRRAHRRGQDILAALGRLQRAVLQGTGEGNEITDLAALLESMPDAEDPALRSAVRAIALRARVELALREI